MPKLLEQFCDFLDAHTVKRYTLEEISQRVAMHEGLSYWVVYNNVKRIMEGTDYDRI